MLKLEMIKLPRGLPIKEQVRVSKVLFPLNLYSVSLFTLEATEAGEKIIDAYVGVDFSVEVSGINPVQSYCDFGKQI
jgi:hypothetical protein